MLLFNRGINEGVECLAQRGPVMLDFSGQRCRQRGSESSPLKVRRRIATGFDCSRARR